MESAKRATISSGKKPQAIALLEELLKHSRDLLRACTIHLVKNIWSKLMFIALIVFLGLVLTSLRIAIFLLIPPVLANIVPETYVLDAVLTFIEAEAFTVQLAWDFITKAVEFASIGAVDFPQIGAAPKSFKIYKLKPGVLENAIKTFATTCAPYDSVTEIVGRSFRVYLGPVICPVIRYVYPVPWLYRILNVLFGWMSPDPTPAGFHGENNCKEDPGDFAWPCATIGIGYVILELVLPLTIAFILIETLFLPLVRIIYTLFKIDLFILTRVLKASAGLINTTDRIILRVAKDKDV